MIDYENKVSERDGMSAIFALCMAINRKVQQQHLLKYNKFLRHFHVVLFDTAVQNAPCCCLLLLLYSYPFYSIKIFAIIHFKLFVSAVLIRMLKIPISTYLMAKYFEELRNEEVKELLELIYLQE